MFRRGCALLALAFLTGCAGGPASANPDSCASLPVGAVAPAPALAWCESLPPGKSTARVGANSWLDDFSGATHAALPDDYLVFEAVRYSPRTYGPSVIVRSRHFEHNGHWMVDLESVGNPPGTYEGDVRDMATGTNFGGAMMRPRRMFSAVGGQFVVEADVSASMAAYKTTAWPEIIVTTAPAPTGVETEASDGFGVFGGAWTYGCRFDTERRAACDVRDPEGTLLGTAKSQFETSAWRECALGAADSECRDRFRLELDAVSPSLTVNGVRLSFAGLPAMPAAMRSAPLYVYFASWAYLSTPTYLRMHWGRIAVNP